MFSLEEFYFPSGGSTEENCTGEDPLSLDAKVSLNEDSIVTFILFRFSHFASVLCALWIHSKTIVTIMKHIESK